MALGINTIKSLIKPAAQPQVVLYYEGDLVEYYHVGRGEYVEGEIDWIDFAGTVYMDGIARAYVVGDGFADYVLADHLRPAGTFAEVE